MYRSQILIIISNVAHYNFLRLREIIGRYCRSFYPTTKLLIAVYNIEVKIACPGCKVYRVNFMSSLACFSSSPEKKIVKTDMYNVFRMLMTIIDYLTLCPEKA